MKKIYAAQLQHKFDPEKILYLTGDVNYCTVYPLEGKAVLSSRTLKWYNERWPEFLRIHKSNLVNPNYIHSCVVLSSTEAYLIMGDGARLAIGRRRIPEVISLLGLEHPKYSSTSTHLLKPEWNPFESEQVLVA